MTKQLSGIGTQNTAAFPLKAGLVVVQGVRASDAGYYYIDLADTTGNKIATPASGSGPRDVSEAVNVRADGMYELLVQADEGWTVNVWQPKTTFSPPPATQKWSGRYSQATPLFSLKAGTAKFHVVGTGGKDIFRVNFLDQNGKGLQAIVTATADDDVSTTVNVPADGVYILRVEFEGDWTVEVQQ